MRSAAFSAIMKTALRMKNPAAFRVRCTRKSLLFNQLVPNLTVSPARAVCAVCAHPLRIRHTLAAKARKWL